MARQDPWEQQHAEETEGYEKTLREAFLAALIEVVALGMIVSRLFKPGRVFRFDDYPLVTERIDKLLSSLEQQIEGIITAGIAAQWTLANAKNDVLCRSVFSQQTIDKMPTELRQRYFASNSAALETFISRQINGLSLSDRIWKCTNQFKAEIELALDIGMREGLSADQLSRQLRQYLNEPARLFRRVRDEHGNLVLSKAARAYHPGQGVYRSSYKNARRLAVTETNIAYMTADYLRWQQLDFVVGIEVRLSGNHTLNGEPFVDICDQLEGRYPKDFKFTGWHPQCRCRAIPILKTEEEMAADDARILRGEIPAPESKNAVKDVPDAFKKWVRDNEARIGRAKSLPYFMLDNEQYVPQVRITDRARQEADQAQTFNEKLAVNAGLSR